MSSIRYIYNENRINAKLRNECAIREAVIAADENFNEDLVKHLCIKKTLLAFGRHGVRDFVLKTALVM